MVGEVKRPPTMVDIASDHIERAIFSGEFSMGEPLRELRLMEDMNVSRGTIRQALNVLHDRGLVDIVPHRGAVVAVLNSTSVIETYSVRSLIEPYAALVAFHEGALDSVLADQLSGILDQMSQAERDNDLAGITRGDVDFHFTLLTAAGHDTLLNVFGNLMARTRLCMFQNILLSGMPASPNPHEHYEIVSAINSGEPHQLVKLLAEHSIKALDRFLKHFPDVDKDAISCRTKLMAQIPWLRLVDLTAISESDSLSTQVNGGIE